MHLRPLAITLAATLTVASAWANDDDGRLTTGSVPVRAAFDFGGASAPRDDLATAKEAISLIERGRGGEADSLMGRIRDPLVRKTVEWMRLRRDNEDVGFERYAAFLKTAQSWPSLGLIRRRAEAALWDDKADAGTVRAFFGSSRPLGGKGKLALARALGGADRGSAEALVRSAWREDAMARETEEAALEIFGSLITRADHRARADMYLYAEETDAALRNAARAGGDTLAVARARVAAIRKDNNLGRLLDAVPTSARNEPNYIYARSQHHRRRDEVKTAAEWMLRAPSDPRALGNLDQWWIERRLLVRRLLDEGDPRTAYRLAATAPVPAKENYRAEREFLAAWVALRYLKDPSTARAHAQRIAHGSNNPTTQARAYYWQGRVAEAGGDRAAARAAFEHAARVPSAYYGQLARARLGLPDLPVRALPSPGAHGRAALAAFEPARAIQVFYDIGRPELAVPIFAEVAERLEPDTLAALAEMTTQRRDARAMLLVGRAGLNRGLPFEAAAFPNVGLPSFTQVGPNASQAVIYAIARQESAFNPRTVSTANALGYMQVTPAAGRYVAKKFNLGFDERRLLSDPIYNMQMGAAELGDLIADYGNYILAFAGYNAGRGRVKEWVARYGDPRDPSVDPVDWVERIPFFETRNYVQRVLENLQIYRVRFTGRTALQIDADMRSAR